MGDKVAMADGNKSVHGSEGNLESSDDYTAAIELSNACREFYRNRVKATESFKQTMNCRNNTATLANSRRTTIDDAMDKLRTEMVSITKDGKAHSIEEKQIKLRMKV